VRRRLESAGACSAWAVVLLSASAAAAAGAEETPPAKPEAKAGAKDTKRMPVPPLATLAQQDKKLKDLYKTDYQKKGTADRTELAKKLLNVAAESKDDALLCYVALREAKDLAAAAGELDTAFAAADALGQTFIVDPNDLKAAALTAAAHAAGTVEAADKVCEGGLELLEQLAKESQFDAAVKLTAPLDDLARRANKPDLAKTIQARGKDLRTQQADWAKAKPFVEKLQANPDDPAAALNVGKYYAVSKGDWEQALPLLAKCSVPALKEAAAKDLANPAEAAERIAVGDLWWALADKEIGPAKAALHGRAASWYGKALEDLTGLPRLKIEKRIESAAAEGGAAEWTDLLALVNLAKQAVRGKWLKQGTGLENTDNGHHVSLEIPKTCPGSYDLQAVFSLKEAERHETCVIFPVGTAQTILALDTGAGFSGLASVNGSLPGSPDNPATFPTPKGQRWLIPVGKNCTLDIHVRIQGANAHVRAEFNGLKLVDWKGKQELLSASDSYHFPEGSKSFGLGGCAATVLWQAVRLRVLAR